jgi:membrane protein
MPAHAIAANVRGVSWKEVGRGLFNEIVNGSVLDLAAQLSYFFLFSLFPLLFFMVALTPYLPVGDVLDDLMRRAAQILPGDVMSIVQSHLTDLVKNPRPNLLSIGLLVALWSASRGVNAFRTGLNLAYDVQESRPYWKFQGLCVVMTLVTTLMVILSFALMIIGGKAGVWLAGKLPGSEHLLMIGSWLRWPAGALIISLALALNYYMLPDVKQEFVYLTPGSIMGTVLWLLSTWGFTKYVEHFGNYNATYGSIGGVVVLMTWLYLTGLIFLLGGKLNALIEHSARGGKERGARAPGEAPLPATERPSAGAPEGSITPEGAAARAT